MTSKDSLISRSGVGLSPSSCVGLSPSSGVGLSPSSCVEPFSSSSCAERSGVAGSITGLTSLDAATSGSLTMGDVSNQSFLNRPVGIRPARPQDLAAVMALETAAFAGGWSPTSWADQIRDRFTIVAETDHVVGVLAMSLVLDTAEILRVIVEPAVRQGGIGRTLLDHGLAWAEAERASEIFLEVSAGNPAAIRLYESRGFVPIDRRTNYYGPGDDALVYRRGLESISNHQEEACLSR